MASTGSTAALILVVFAVIATPMLLSESQQRVFAQQQQLQPNSPEADKLLIQSFIQNVFNEHNLTALNKYYAPNATQHNPGAGQGRQGIKNFFGPVFLAFPDIHVTIEHIIAENSAVLVFLNWTGTHKGEFQGIPPTNKPISMRTADLFRIGTNRTIVEKWDVVDSLNLQRQIGAINQTRNK
jgi:predicted SnoaL-like aldol condensation-catalyzing enzyme